jgi:hypothetical protein
VADAAVTKTKKLLIGIIVNRMPTSNPAFVIPCLGKTGITGGY